MLPPGNPAPSRLRMVPPVPGEKATAASPTKLDSSDTRIQAIIVFVLLGRPSKRGLAHRECTPDMHTPCTVICTPFGVFWNGRKVVDWERLAATIQAPLEAK